MDTTALKRCLRPRLDRLYGERANACLDRIVELAERYAPRIPTRKSTWDQRDALLITYGDMIREGDSTGDRDDSAGEMATGTRPPLQCLGAWLDEAGLRPLLGVVHILPFCPYSSDDGFSVIDYRRVDPALGDWSDVAALGNSYRMMFDLVLNHVSAQSEWFQAYKARRAPFTEYFIEADPSDERLKQVVRPRSLPLLTEVTTVDGPRHVWTTFSPDQIDLNFASPDVLLEMLDVLLGYLQRGAWIVRLDAIAYLWKRLGTSCIHLEETHEVVRLMRDLVDAVAPGTILLTETNVPHEENFSYFGAGDEARMVYQFSLAPLLLEALLSGDASLLQHWLSTLEPPPPGCTVLNFTASHDGIGVRPLEGLMPRARFDRLIEAVDARGGRVSTKRNADGSDSPYELNITYYSALGEPGEEDSPLQIERFLASQAVMLSLQGMPGIYFHSLIGTPNHRQGVAEIGRARSINRRKFELDELRARLDDPEAAPRRVLDGYRRLLAVRAEQPAFHPEGAQHVLDLDSPAVLGFLRTSPDGRERVLVLANCGPQPWEIDRAALSAAVREGGAAGGHATAAGLTPSRDLLGDDSLAEAVRLRPYQVAWLVE